MPSVDQYVAWFSSGEGRLILVAVLFLIMWAVKSVPYVKGLLTTPRRKQAASLLLAMGPAVWLIAEGAPPIEVISAALGIVFAANGLNTYRPSKAKSDG